jgi:hypothetical protein
MTRTLTTIGLIALGGLGAAGCHRGIAAEPAVDRLLTDASAEVFSIGAAEGDATQALQHVGGVAFDAADNLYVLDSGAGQVQVYAPDGRYVRSIGSKGRGPGELHRAMQVAVTTGGKVVVSDLGQRGFSVFAADGTFERLVPFEVGRGVAGLELRASNTGGFVTAYQPVPGPKPEAQSVVIVASDPGGGALSTLFTVPQGSGSAGMLDPRAPAFSPRVHWAVLPDGRTVVAYGTGYELRYATQGASETVVGRGISPRHVSNADRDRERESRLEALEHEGAALPPATRNAVLKMVREMRFAEVMPVINGIVADPAGYVWVQRTSDDGSATGPIDLIGPNGGYVGTVTGQRLPLAVSASGRAAYLERDELEVERIVVRQVPAAWRSKAN